jgi:hypothetical protein
MMEETDWKLDSRGPIVDVPSITSNIEWMILRESTPLIGRGINLLTNKPNDWQLPILSNIIVPDVIINGNVQP